MDPIDTLRNEHGLIRRFVDLLSQAVTRLEVETPPPRAFFDNGIEFVRGFSDGFHHKKEELVMFKQLAQMQNGAIDGQIEALRYQHDQGRAFIAAIAGALDNYAKGEPADIAVVRENAASFASLLKHHIHVEDHIFYPMAKKTLTEEEFAALVPEFEKQREKQGADTFERCHKMVVDMGSIVTHLQ